MRVRHGCCVQCDAQSHVLEHCDKHVHEAIRALASHIDLLPDPVIPASLAAFFFGVPARDTEGVQASTEWLCMSGDHEINLAVAFELPVKNGDPFADRGLGVEDVER